MTQYFQNLPNPPQSPNAPQAPGYPAAPPPAPAPAPPWQPGYPTAPQPPPGYPTAPPAWAPVDPLAAIADARTFQRAPYFPAGLKAKMRLESLRQIVAPTTKAPIVVAEFTVAEGPNPGQLYGCSFDLSPQNRYGAPECKKLLTALFGKIPGNQQHESELAAAGMFSPAAIAHALSDAQPLKGRCVTVETSEKKTRIGPNAKNPQGVITVFFWLPA